MSNQEKVHLHWENCVRFAQFLLAEPILKSDRSV